MKLNQTKIDKYKKTLNNLDKFIVLDDHNDGVFATESFAASIIANSSDYGISQKKITTEDKFFTQENFLEILNKYSNNIQTIREHYRELYDYIDKKRNCILNKIITIIINNSFIVFDISFISKKLDKNKKSINFSASNYTVFYNENRNGETVNQIKSDIISICKKEIKRKPKNQPIVNFIYSNSSRGLMSKSIILKEKIKIDFDNYYNDDFKHKELINIVNKKEQNGLILLGGLPGTGKSTFIRYIATKSKKQVVFLPSYMLSELESPNFIEFTINHLKDSILVIEEAERILVSRDNNRNPAISTILNLSSGTLGIASNITIIATYNTIEKIDTALLRKGRLLYQYDFKKLSIQKCNNISQKNNHGITYTEEKVLSDVLNIEDNNALLNNRNQIGFI